MYWYIFVCFSRHRTRWSLPRQLCRSQRKPHSPTNTESVTDHLASVSTAKLWSARTNKRERCTPWRYLPRRFLTQEHLWEIICNKNRVTNSRFESDHHFTCYTSKNLVLSVLRTLSIGVWVFFLLFCNFYYFYISKALTFDTVIQ